MLLIKSADIKLDPETFTPWFHVHFAIDLYYVRNGIDAPEHDIATIIGNEIISQAKIWEALTRQDTMQVDCET